MLERQLRHDKNLDLVSISLIPLPCLQPVRNKHFYVVPFHFPPWDGICNRSVKYKPFRQSLRRVYLLLIYIQHRMSLNLYHMFLTEQIIQLFTWLPPHAKSCFITIKIPSLSVCILQWNLPTLKNKLFGCTKSQNLMGILLLHIYCSCGRIMQIVNEIKYSFLLCQ